MKKLLLLLVSIFTVYGCAGDAATRPDQFQTQTAWHESSRDSLDYWGTYVPVEGSSGRSIAKVELMPENKYLIRQADGAEITGVYDWDDNGSVLYLKENGRNRSRLLVGEGYVQMLSRGVDRGKIFKKE